VLKILQFILDLEEGHPLITNLFVQGKLISFLHEQAIEDEAILKRIHNKEKGACRKGYLGHIVKIGQLLSASTNPQIVAYLSGNRLSYSDENWPKVRELVEKETYESEKNLAGYTTRKTDSNNVMFHKEVSEAPIQDIMAMHQAFLSKPPFTVFA